ncbi:MAG: histidine--tRNA ligase [Hyphomicrobiaceae bacterium]
MAKKNKQIRPKARLPRGLRDIEATEIRAVNAMLEAIRDVYDSYGFEPLETPAFEYSDALGKFLPDQDRPNAGVFSFEEEDGQWVSLRYDLTAPLARFVAENYDGLAKPYRRYQVGPVWRNEKPGPGRYREFTQFDADTVGTDNVAADAEICMLAADAIERIGIPRGDYVIRINNRKVLDGVLETAGIDPEAPENAAQRMIVLRAIDKLDRLGRDGVEQLLGKGRKDESGDYTKGAELEPQQIAPLLDFVSAAGEDRDTVLARLLGLVGESARGREGVEELRRIGELLSAAGFEDDRARIDPAVVRGLDYYTGPVFEAELTFKAEDDEGQLVRFGSVGGGGRYDGLVARFKGVTVPATGFSIGVSRLYAALKALGKIDDTASAGPVVVLVMDPDRIADYQNMTRDLRDAGIRAEMYLGTSGMRAQMKYADKRRAPCVVIQGADERDAGEVTIKDLVEGARLSEEIEDNKTWREGRPAQFSVKRAELVEAVQSVLARYTPA